MEEACSHIERIVNNELKKRSPYPLEWTEPSGQLQWHANVAAANRYDGPKDSVGFHSDQLTYLGPYATIASLSLGETLAMYRLRTAHWATTRRHEEFPSEGSGAEGRNIDSTGSDL